MRVSSILDHTSNNHHAHAHRRQRLGARQLRRRWFDEFGQIEDVTSCLHCIHAALAAIKCTHTAPAAVEPRAAAIASRAIKVRSRCRFAFGRLHPLQMHFPLMLDFICCTKVAELARRTLATTVRLEGIISAWLAPAQFVQRGLVETEHVSWRSFGPRPQKNVGGVSTTLLR